MAPKSSTKPDKSESVSYDFNDVVLGKVRGFPAWPGMIVDPDTVPTPVHRERPQNKKTAFYCVRFFPVGDYAWLVAKDISRLKKEEIQAYIAEPHKKSGDLLQGYRIALNPQKWSDERPAAAQTADHDVDVDQLDDMEDDDEDGPKRKTSKKRKRESEAPVKPKATKSKKKDDDSPAPTKKKVATKAKKTKSKATVESEDERDAEDAGPSKKEGGPATKKSKKDKEAEDDSEIAKDPEAFKVRDWRHKLQKSFLGKKVPEPADMPGLDELFTTVEGYEKITIEYLSFSKIGKVMRHIAMLDDSKVPRNGEFHFKARAQNLVDRWHGVLGSNTKANGTNGSASVAPVSAPAMNGANGDAMDEDAKKDEDAPGDVEVPDADADVAKVELPANDVGNESVLPDVTMSE